MAGHANAKAVPKDTENKNPFVVDCTMKQQLY
jgi:hypothetical protein